MSVPSFFGSLFGELIPGGDCSIIEQDPHADPFDKEVCQQFRRFNDALGGSFNIEHRSPEERDVGEKGQESDPQTLRDSILNRPKEKQRKEIPHRWPRSRKQPRDEDLDESIRRDPRLLDQYLEKEDPPQQAPHCQSSFSSVVITTRPDGTYEERRTVRDADGNEEVTVTYSDGKQAHVHTEKHSQTHSTDQDDKPIARIWDWLGYK